MKKKRIIKLVEIIYDAMSDFRQMDVELHNDSINVTLHPTDIVGLFKKAGIPTECTLACDGYRVACKENTMCLERVRSVVVLNKDTPVYKAVYVDDRGDEHSPMFASFKELSYAKPFTFNRRYNLDINAGEIYGFDCVKYAIGFHCCATRKGAKAFIKCFDFRDEINLSFIESYTLEIRRYIIPAGTEVTIGSSEYNEETHAWYKVYVTPVLINPRIEEKTQNESH